MGLARIGAVLLVLSSAGDAGAGGGAVELGLGLRAEAMRDDLLVPLGFAGPGVELEAGVRHELLGGVLALRLSGGPHLLQGSGGQLGVGLGYGGDLRWLAAALRRPGLRLAAGGALVVDVRSHLVAAWDDSRAYWIAQDWIGPAGGLTAGLAPRWRLESFAAVALVGRQSRPPAQRMSELEPLDQPSYWLIEPHRNGAFAGPARLAAARVEVGVRRRSIDAPDAAGGPGVHLALRAMRAAGPAPAIDLSATMMLSLGWEWTR
jgi:hypothetical protein